MRGEGRRRRGKRSPLSSEIPDYRLFGKWNFPFVVPTLCHQYGKGLAPQDCENQDEKTVPEIVVDNGSWGGVNDEEALAVCGASGQRPVRERA